MSSHGTGDAAGAAEQDEALRALRHDLRTPVNHIMGYSELLYEEAEEAGADAAASALQRIYHVGKELLGLINDSLDPARLGADRSGLLALRAQLRAPIGVIMDVLVPLEAEARADGREENVADLLKIRTASERLLALSDRLLAHVPPSAAVVEPVAEPAQELAQEASPGQAREADAPAAAGAAPGAILVVDDNAVNRMMLSRRLEREGHTVVVAVDGRQALELVRSQPFDMVLLDIMMPEVDGYTVLETIKADPALCHLPVLMISALTELESIVRCIERGAEDYLPKPFDPVLLRARISASLEKKRLRDQEMHYLRQVAVLTEAAAAVEQGVFDPASLDALATREDPLGQLARVFQVMAIAVFRREASLRQELEALRGEIAQGRAGQPGVPLSDAEYFQELRRKVQALRRMRGKAPASGAPEDRGQG